MEMTPHINKLDLTAEELAALRRQGFVSRERRRGRTLYKLRFRLSTAEQRVRYLGTDPAAAAEIEEELYEIQRGTRLKRELHKCAKETGRRLRSSKAKLAPVLAEAGYHFHGLSVRQTRAI